jgi:hypothetical protein
MTADAKPPGPEHSVERRSRDRVADDADWETKVLARIRGKLRRGADESESQSETQAETPANWEEQVAAKIKERSKSSD